MSLELLRNRWTYPVLVALLDGPLRASQLLKLINEGTARNADLGGSRALHEKVLLTTLRQMEEEGLLLCQRVATDPMSGRGPRELTAAGKELLHSMHRVAAWAAAHRDQLAVALRNRRGRHQPAAGLAGLPVGVPVLSPEQEHWRGVGMTLAVLRLRWGFAVLCQLSHGPQHPTGVAAAVNAGIARNRDLTGRRSLSEKVLWDTLHRLIDVGLVIHRPRPGQFASTARCTLTPAGHAVLAALVPVGDWAADYERRLLVIVRRRRGLLEG
ncbi:winged helix-turn-helix transcriptional regulator [Streptomyces sp. NPDC091215]|uniref:winged helix-turn-helix transcriptional regulator n=1 Tax=Streptomyces sp. NPDC091215 TaxID=3155192 RepID=UPI00343883AF